MSACVLPSDLPSNCACTIPLSSTKKLNVCLTTNPIPKIPINNSNTDLSALHASFLKGKQWDQGANIKIGFLEDGTGQLNGEKIKKSKIIQHFVSTIIEPLINLKFIWDTIIPTVDAQSRMVR